MSLSLRANAAGIAGRWNEALLKLRMAVALRLAAPL